MLSLAEWSSHWRLGATCSSLLNLSVFIGEGLAEITIFFDQNFIPLFYGFSHWLTEENIDLSILEFFRNSSDEFV